MRRLSLRCIWLVVLAFLISGCGGGGGGSDGGGGGDQTGGISYVGLTTQAQLTPSNANRIFGLFWTAGSSSELASPASKTAAARPTASAATVGDTIVAALAKKFMFNVTGVKSLVPINETVQGQVSGTLTLSGSVDDSTGTGSVVMTYADFNDGNGYSYDGGVTMRIAGFDPAAGVITDATMSCTILSARSAAVDFSISGSIRMQVLLQSNSEVITIDLDGRDNRAKETFRFANFVLTSVYDSLTSPTAFTQTYSGRFYLERFGYVEINTVSPCLFAEFQSDPGSGGPIVLAGAGNSSVKVTPLSTSQVTIELDAEGDGIFESKKNYAWSNLEGAPVAVPAAMPVASKPAYW